MLIIMFCACSVNEDTTREYFPFPEVWKSLCSFAEDLFGIQIKRTEVPVWNQDVSFFDVFDQNSRQKLGSFYLDPYSR
jgi:Zn-dependent oligopeptidase